MQAIIGFLPMWIHLTFATKPLWEPVSPPTRLKLASTVQPILPLTKPKMNQSWLHNALLIHISTDYVFGGEANEPYKVDDPINPQSVYGSTKAEGERLIRESGCCYMIVRTAWLYSSVGKNFVKTMLMLGDTKDEINVVADQKGCPTWAHDLAVALVALLNKNGKNEVHETFHFTNEGQITWYDFAVAIMEVGGKTCKVNPITTDQYPTKAKRPAYSVLDLSKIKECAGIEIPDWRESLEKCIEELKHSPVGATGH